MNEDDIRQIKNTVSRIEEMVREIKSTISTFSKKVDQVDWEPEHKTRKKWKNCSQ